MATALDPRRAGEPRSTEQADCRKFGLVQITGRNPDFPLNQIARNYAYYARSVWAQRDKHVAVVRTEHLWDDLTRLEVLMGGQVSTYGSLPHVQSTQGSENSAVNTEMSADAATALCCVVPDELRVYQSFLAAAVNLRPSDIRESLVALHETCRGGARGSRVPATTRGLVNWDWLAWAQRECQRP